MEFIHHFWILFALPWLAIARLVVDICDTQGKQKTDNNEGDEEDVKTIIKIHINIHFDANYVVYFVRYEKISNKRNAQMPFANMLFLMFTINLMKPKNRFFTRTLAIRFFLSILGQITHRRWKRKKKPCWIFYSTQIQQMTQRCEKYALRSLRSVISYVCS